MTNLIMGYGQIGQAVHKFVGKADIIDKTILNTLHNYNHDILHVCFPYSKDFVKEVQRCVKNYTPKHVIIYSTVPIGTTRQIPKAVHSPVESRHPDLLLGIEYMPRWMGCNDETEGLFFVDYFQRKGLGTMLVNNSDFTEALKLLSTTEYGINIVFADYKKRIADDIGMDFELTKDWNRDYNKLYQDLGLGDTFQKFVLDAPKGKIGGHCVRENSRILNRQYPDDWIRRIGDMEKKC